ncbi:SH3 domain-containing protein [Stappia sp. MMSF_3263]|uniref:SH3 domain-containing protein n=1 Tax=Stappia sp. MMSF_3263 TaxID=3046693 RepID=UPI00273E3B33|nr:SH3 domain-containing protein [Stappia sp. MMSF_3263]
MKISTHVSSRLRSGIAAVALGLLLGPVLAAYSVHADDLDVPIHEYGGDDLPTCATSVVSGLKAGGDGFLAVRSGPGSQYREIGRLKNGDKVFTFDKSGKWFGVVFGGSEPGCTSPVKKRLLPYRGRKGWVHGNWLADLAG